jgi:hypothetical protein
MVAGEAPAAVKVGSQASQILRLALRCATMLAKRSTYLISLGAALIAAGTAGIVVGQSQSSVSSGRGASLAIGIAFLVLGAFSVGASLVSVARDNLERSRIPFVLEHDEDDRQCRQFDFDTGIQLRVKVRNSGETGLIHVRARANLKNGHEHWLRIRHDNVRPFDRSQVGEILPPRPDFWVYFDVAYLHFDHRKTAIQYADEFLRNDSLSTTKDRQILITIWGTREDDGTTVKERAATFDLVNTGDDLHLTTHT